MLKVEQLTASYSGIQALRGVDFSITEGEVVALIGPNGAGKSTLLNCLSGTVRRQGGKISFAGKEIGNWAPHRVARDGLLHVPEGRQILGEMSILENLLIGRRALGQRTSAYDLKAVFALFPILEERQASLGSNLSGGQQQMLAIGRALMGGPSLLMLDEPSLGLSPLMSNNVFDALVKLNRDGLTILIVEQNAVRALAASSRAYVLEHGRIAHHGISAELAQDPRVIAHYLGQDAEDADGVAAPAH